MKEGKEQSIPANLDTLVFLPEEGFFYQVWRGLISITDTSLNDIEEIVVEYEQVPCSPKSDQVPLYR